MGFTQGILCSSHATQNADDKQTSKLGTLVLWLLSCRYEEAP